MQIIWIEYKFERWLCYNKWIPRDLVDVVALSMNWLEIHRITNPYLNIRFKNASIFYNNNNCCTIFCTIDFCPATANFNKSMWGFCSTTM